MPKSHTILAGENDQNYHPVAAFWSPNPPKHKAKDQGTGTFLPVAD
jgi:hypothetical protein